ncbi:MAG: hypothetical protein ABI177_01305 [Edaphobacter sp.]
MPITQRRSNPDDDFLNIEPDATATFDSSPSNPTEHASSENLDATDDVDDDKLEDEDLDEEDDDDDDEEYEDDDDDDDEEEEEDEDDEEEDDLARGPKAPSVYRKV